MMHTLSCMFLCFQWWLSDGLGLGNKTSTCCATRDSRDPWSKSWLLRSKKQTNKTKQKTTTRPCQGKKLRLIMVPMGHERRSPDNLAIAFPVKNHTSGRHLWRLFCWTKRVITCHKFVFPTEFIFCNDPKSNSKIPLTFCQGNQRSANFQISSLLAGLLMLATGKPTFRKQRG